MLNLKFLNMKKLFFLFAILMGGIFYANAQVIELVGHGVRDVNEYTLDYFSDPSITKVVVEAAAVYRNGAVPGVVKFNGNDATFKLTEEDFCPSFANGGDAVDPYNKYYEDEQNWGYYQMEFTSDFSGGITLNKNGLGTQVVSFIAYIYKGNDPEIYSTVNFNHVLFFKNGSGKPYTYLFSDIPVSSDSRNITVVVPFSEMTEDERYAFVKVTAGTVIIERDFDSNNKDHLLNLETFILENVPGNVTEVTVEIYSPSEADKSINGGKEGDSFITSAVLLTTTVKHEGGCTRTIGYWKTHSEYGPAGPADPTWELVGGPDAPFFESGKTYFQVLWTPPAGNPYYILAVQYIAAELNILAGADGSAVAFEMVAAESLLNEYTPAEVKALSNNDNDKKLFKSLAGILDDYNNGLIGPGHCDDVEQEMEAEETELKVATLDVSVHPNPIKNNGTIVFKPIVDGKATVDLFDAMGNKKATLFNQKVRPDMPVNLMLNARNYKSGNYVVVVTNGHTKASLKVKIGR
jgi:hypothetical protein